MLFGQCPNRGGDKLKGVSLTVLIIMMIGGFVQKKPTVTESSPGSRKGSSKKIDVKKLFHD